MLIVSITCEPKSSMKFHFKPLSTYIYINVSLAWWAMVGTVGWTTQGGEGDAVWGEPGGSECYGEGVSVNYEGVCRGSGCVGALWGGFWGSE